MSKRKCIVLRYCAGHCSVCQGYVGENMHALDNPDGGGSFGLYCGGCCPLCKPSEAAKAVSVAAKLGTGHV